MNNTPNNPPGPKSDSADDHLTSTFTGPLLDMDRHFSARLHKLLTDVIDTCDRLEIDRDDTCRMVMTNLWYELSMAAVAIKMSKSDFMECSGMAHDAMKERHRQWMKKKS